MKIKLFLPGIILCFVIPITHCMKSFHDTNSHKLPNQNAYDCQKLIAEYAVYGQLSADKKDLAFDDTLKKWLPVRSGKPSVGWLLKYASEHKAEQKALSDNLAALVCFGVNPNRVVIGNVSRSHGYGIYPAHETRDYLCAVDYAVETDNSELASFLISHKAWKHTHLLTWFASVKDWFFGEPPYYAWKITREKRDHIFLKICSVAMAKLFVSSTGIHTKFSEKKTVAHHVAENDACGIELLNYYLEQREELADTIDRHKNTPLHRLANTCEYAQYFPAARENLHAKTKLLAQKTKNINALNAEGKTALDIASSKRGCESFITIVQAYGGKSANAVQRGNDDYKTGIETGKE